MLDRVLEVVRGRAAGEPHALSEEIASLIEAAPAEVRDVATVLGTRDVRAGLP